MSYHGLGATQAEVVTENNRRQAEYQVALATWQSLIRNNAQSCAFQQAQVASNNGRLEADYQAQQRAYEAAKKEYDARVDADALALRAAQRLNQTYTFTVPPRGCVTAADKAAYEAECKRATTALRGGLWGLGLTAPSAAQLTQAKAPLVVAAKDTVTSKTATKADAMIALELKAQKERKIPACGLRQLSVCGPAPGTKPQPPMSPRYEQNVVCATDPPKPVLALLDVPSAPPPAKPQVPIVSTPSVPVYVPPPSKMPTPVRPPSVVASPPPVYVPSAPPDVVVSPVPLPPEPAPLPEESGALSIGGVLFIAAAAGGVLYLVLRKRKAA